MTSLKWFSLNGAGNVLSFTGNFNVAGDINFTGDLYQNGTLVGVGGGGGGSSQWTSIFGSGIYYNGPVVGIGLTNPSSSYKLDVAGNINFTGDIYKNGVLFTGSSGGALLWSDVAGELSTLVNVGIGTNNPENNLHVSATTTSFSTTNGIRLGEGNNFATFNYVIPPSGTEYLLIQSTKSGVGNDRNIVLNPSGGFVGIGKTDPGQALDVFGNVNITGDFMVNGVPLSGGGGSGSWLADGVNIYYDAGNVGIGTFPSGTYALQVNGDMNLFANTDVFRIGGSEVLSRTALGSTVTSSSLTSLGNLTGLVVDTDTIYVDSTSHMVGIGKTDPAYKLDVVGVVNSTGGFYANGSAIISETSPGVYALGPTITGSSLTSLGTLTSLSLNGDLNLQAGSEIKVGATTVLSDTTLGSTVTSSSLTSVGTLSSLTVSGNVSVDTNTFYVDTTNKWVGIGTAVPKSTLHIFTPSTDVVQLGTPAVPDGYLMIGDPAGYNMAFDTNEIYARNNGAASPLYLQANGGDLQIHSSPTIVGSEVIILDNGNVGIGTMTTTYKLQVQGDINFTGSLYQNGVAFSGGGSSQWTTTGSDIYYTTGSVGIGTNAPSTKLHVYSVNNGSEKIHIGNGTYGLFLTNGTNTGYVPAVQGVASDSDDSGLQIVGKLASDVSTNVGLLLDARRNTNTALTAAKVLQLNNYSTNLITVDFSGNVGIGITNPTEKLVVAGAIRSTSNSADFNTGGLSAFMDLHPTGFARIGTVNGGATPAGVQGDTAFFARGSEHMRIEGSSGFVGIGTNNPEHKLHVLDSSVGAFAAQIIQSGAGTGYGVNIDVAASSGTDDALRIRNGGGAATIFSVKPTGVAKSLNLPGRVFYAYIDRTTSSAATIKNTISDSVSYTYDTPGGSYRTRVTFSGTTTYGAFSLAYNNITMASSPYQDYTNGGRAINTILGSSSIVDITTLLSYSATFTTFPFHFMLLYFD